MASAAGTGHEIERRLRRVSELVPQARTAFYTMLAATAFAAIAVAGFADRDFFLAGVSTQVPIIDFQVSTVAFFLVTPFLLIAVYANFQFYVLKLWTELARLPGEVALDGVRVPVAEALPPWMMVEAGVALRPGEKPATLSYLLSLVSLFLAWWAAPLTLGLFWVRSWAYHSLWLSMLLSLLTVLSLCVGYFVHTSGREALSGRQRPAAQRRWTAAAAIVLAVLFLAVSLLTTMGGRYGLPQILLWPTDLYRAEIAGRPADWIPRRQAEAEYLRDHGTSTESRLDFAERRNHFLLSFESGDLSDADLRRADLRYAFLPAAIMVRADLGRARLYSAQMEGALLDNAHFDEARLVGADLSCARLPDATFNGAYMVEARLANAQLTKAKMVRANLERADLSSADLSGADLAFANLSGTDLSNAVIGAHTNLKHAIASKQTKLPPANPPITLATCFRGLNEEELGRIAAGWRMQRDAFTKDYVCKGGTPKTVLGPLLVDPSQVPQRHRCWPVNDDRGPDDFIVADGDD